MLKIKRLRVTVAGKKVVNGIDLEVGPGEIHALMGPNGSGKSSLAHALMGHPSYEVDTQKGSIKLDGKELMEMSPDERAQAGLFLAFQYPVEIAGVRVLKFLKEARNARFETDANKQFKSLFELKKYCEKLAQELKVKPELLGRGLNEGFSGGEKKRLEILQMAVLEPKYAILDETDSGLDIDAIKAVALGVRQIAKRFNTGVVVITHYQRILKYLKPSHVHVMVGGRMVEEGGMEIVKRLEEKGYEVSDKAKK